MKENDFFFVDVKCYEGYKEAEYPLSFHWGIKHIEIKEIIDQWQDPAHTYFKIKDTNESIYIIRRNIETNKWQIVFYHLQ